MLIKADMFIVCVFCGFFQVTHNTAERALT